MPPEAITGILDRVGHGVGQLELVTVGGPVAIHAREQDLARAAVRGLARPLDRFAIDGVPSPFT